MRRGALAVAVATGLLVLTALAPVLADAKTLSAELISRAAPFVGLSVVGGISTVVALFLRRFTVARILAPAAVTCVVPGWGVAQHPWLLVDELRIDSAAHAPATLQAPADSLVSDHGADQHRRLSADGPDDDDAATRPGML